MEKDYSREANDYFKDMITGAIRPLPDFVMGGRLKPRPVLTFEIKQVIFNDPATIVIWADNTKTVVKAQHGDKYDEFIGLAMCIAKRAYGNTGAYNKVFKSCVPGYGEPDVQVYVENKDVYELFENGSTRKLSADETKEVKQKFFGGGTRKSKVDSGKLAALYKAGWTPEQIADEMSIHVTTVYNYIRRMKDDFENIRNHF